MGIKIKGDRFVDLRGKPVSLWGVNLFYFSHQYQNGTDAAAKASALELEWAEQVLKPPPLGGFGVNLLTFWVDTNPALGLSPAWRNHVNRLVDLCNKYDATLLLSWHNDDGQMGHTKLIDMRGMQAMGDMAKTYRLAPVIFAVQAEPPGDIGITWASLKQACMNTISVIRAVNADAVIGIPGLSWSQNVKDMAGPDRIALPGGVPAPGIFVKVHNYGAMPKTVIDNGNEMIIAQGDYPLLIGEFGPRSAPAGLMTIADANNLMSWAIEKDDLVTRGVVNLCGWALTTKGSPEMLDAAGGYTEWGKLFLGRTKIHYKPPTPPVANHFIDLANAMQDAAAAFDRAADILRTMGAE